MIVDETLLSEEPLLMQVWSKRASPLPDYLIGESRARLDALISAGGKATPTTFELGRPGHRQQGVISCSLSFEQQEETGAMSGIHQKLTEASRDAIGSLGLALTINHDAEAATEAYAGAHTAHLERQEVLRTEREAAAVAAANNRLDVQSHLFIENSKGNASNTVGEKYGGEATLRRQHLPKFFDCRSSADFHGGIDPITGLPWRIDNAGCRRGAEWCPLQLKNFFGVARKRMNGFGGVPNVPDFDRFVCRAGSQQKFMMLVKCYCIYIGTVSSSDPCKRILLLISCIPQEQLPIITN